MIDFSFLKPLSQTLNPLYFPSMAAAAGVYPPQGNSSAASSGGAEELQEESGWTDYLGDYLSSEIDRESSYLCSSIGSCSWSNISEANYNENINVEVSLDVPKKLSFKKTRTQKIFEDDSLEDTATSPIQSPKVADLKVTKSHVNPRFDDHMINSSTGSGGLSGNYYSKTEEVVYSAAELKKKGFVFVSFVHAS